MKCAICDHPEENSYEEDFFWIGSPTRFLVCWRCFVFEFKPLAQESKEFFYRVGEKEGHPILELGNA